jgi:hypothetical protein
MMVVKNEGNCNSVKLSIIQKSEKDSVILKSDKL